MSVDFGLPTSWKRPDVPHWRLFDGGTADKEGSCCEGEKLWELHRIAARVARHQPSLDSGWGGEIDGV